MLSETDMPRKDIVSKLGYNSVTGNLRNAINNLLNNGLIEYTIPEKPRSRNQKYKLTELGKNLNLK